MLVRISDTLAVIDAAAELGLPAWVGLSLARDGDALYLGIQGRHGDETLQDAMDAIRARTSRQYSSCTPRSTTQGRGWR